MIIIISRPLESDIMNFVKLNSIEDTNGFLESCLRDGFNIAKYGVSPQDNFNKENKPFKVEKSDAEKETKSEGVERVKPKKRGRPKKQSSVDKEVSKPIEEKEESIKPKKTIKIIKK